MVKMMKTALDTMKEGFNGLLDKQALNSMLKWVSLKPARFHIMEQSGGNI
jgi:hypothetical protein